MTEFDITKVAIDAESLAEMSPEGIAARSAAMKSLGKELLRPGIKQVNPKAVIDMGRRLREGQLWEYPYLPGAVSVFQQLAAGREWVISGKPRAVSRAVEWVQGAQVVDRQTGYVYYGYENFLKRRVLDYLTIGRTAFVVHKQTGRGKEPVLEYLDPVYLKFNRKNVKTNVPVKPTDEVWNYDGRDFQSKQVVIDHPLPIGTNMFISPIAPIIPSATLAWLIREHHMASVDGRKIRDILFVANPTIKEAISHAIKTSAALWAGESVEKVGLPIVALNNISGQSVEDLYAILGLSKMPENFKEEEFVFSYVNEIAGNLSLALRHFWNSERSTNKALEEVQERRGQNKGPAMFTRSEQRLMAIPMVFEHINGGSTKRGVRFGFVEEIDAAARLDNATILEKNTRALGQLAKVFNASISLEGYMAWMQSLGVLPNEMKLIESSGKNNAVMNPDEPLSGSEDDATMESDPQPNAFPDETKYLKGYIDYDEVTMNGKGEIVDKRIRPFTVAKVIAGQIIAERKAEEANQPKSAEDAYMLGIEAISIANRVLLRKFWYQIEEEVLTWVKSQRAIKRSEIEEVIDLCQRDGQLTDRQQFIVDELVERFTDEPTGEIFNT